MELKQKAKTEVYHFEAESQNKLQSPYQATLTVEDSKFQLCDVSIKSPTTREHWAFFALVAAKINQICGSEIPMDEWQSKSLSTVQENLKQEQSVRTQEAVFAQEP